MNTKSYALLFTCLSLFFGITSVVAQNQTVSSPTDGVGNDLRTAVANAGPGDTITFLPLVADANVLSQGEIVIDKPLVILGNGSGQTTISGAGNTGRTFRITTADSVIINGIGFLNASTDSVGAHIYASMTRLFLDECAFSGGEADSSGGAIHFSGLGDFVIENSSFTGNTAAGNAATLGGGAIYNEAGQLVIRQTTFDGNTATGTSGSGGAIFLTNGASLVSDTCDYTSNTAVRAGGAVEDRSGSATTVRFTGNTFIANQTGSNPGNGGAIHISGDGTMFITGDTYQGNLAAREGGGVWNGSGSMTISSSSFTGNVASGDAPDDGGGAIFNNGGILIIQNNTLIESNVAEGLSGSGGGVFNYTAGMNAANMTIVNSIITNNSASRAGGGIEDNSGSTFPLNLIDVTLDSNTTASNPGNGGGLHITGPGDVNITDGFVRGNVASAEGGGLWNGAGVMTVDGTFISGNTASGDGSDQGGGGIYNLSGVLTVTGATITDNVADGAAGSGGGILSDAGSSYNLTNTIVRNNSAVRAGGGIEDNTKTAGAETNSLLMVNLDSNSVASSPGNGGGLHITGDADLTVNGGTVNGNFASAEGGGLWNGAGTMTVTGTSILGNTASGDAPDQGGGGIFNLRGELFVVEGTIIRNNVADGAAGSGGGILNDSAATLTINTATIANNTAVRAGGGIEDVSGDATVVTINNAVLNGNTAASSPGNGGALHVTGAGDVSINASSIVNNLAAAEGGGLWNGSGTMTVDGCSIENNVANGDNADQGGGGIYNLSGTLVVQNGTVISGNTALGTAGSGGGILNDVGGTLTVSSSTLNENECSRAGGAIEDNSGSATTITLNNVEMARNTTGDAPGNGGALHITGAGNATITGGTVRGNIAAAEGGGLWNGTGLMTVDGTTLDSNIANGMMASQGGGALFNLRGEMEVSNATIAYNLAPMGSGSGGGILNDSAATLTVSNCIIVGNEANRAGGGIEDRSGNTTLVTVSNTQLDSNATGAAPGNGGAIHISGNGDMFVTGGSVTANSAAAEGGGLWNGAGTMTVEDIVFTDNVALGDGADQGGGALFNVAGTMIVLNCEFDNNRATGTSGSGGAILTDVGTTLTVDSCLFTNNTSNRAGGAIESNAGAGTNMVITDSDFDSNITGDAPGNGGAIHLTGAGDSEIIGGSFTNNEAGREGGAIWNGSGEMVIAQASISGNNANGVAENDGGGGVFNNGGILVINRSTINNNAALSGDGSGGGIHNNGGIMDLNFSTVSANQTNRYGGGIYNNGDMSILASTITENVTTFEGGGLAQNEANSTITLSSTLVASNEESGGNGSADFVNPQGTYVSDGYNLIGVDEDGIFPLKNTDIVGTTNNPVDPVLGALTDNGGPTFTHALICGSPAIEAGDPAITDNDQRDSLVFGNTRDIGAFEIQTNCVSIQEAAAKSYVTRVYPNPILSGNIQVTIPTHADADYRIIELASGKVLEQGALNSGENAISFNRYNAGAYSIQVMVNGNTETHRVVKLK